ncbi:cation:proton antiporter [Thermosulfurimonas sp. F29]|uniref:cation:proton antiporter n=1 Tax=Thermosulfurimonas sp. F29 TaxID=2867247 RepID=UPI001C83F3A5|nr:cation:proton antiporter [Thermosulfurimonas sp. F29]MBX6422105.1 cation:proton antiporter [Thermosulfurimonas sp. F29]
MLNTAFLLDLLLVLCGAWALGYVAQRLGLPVMLGELVAGLILGPPVLGLVSPSESLELLAELGIFFAMFYAGLEMDPRELLEHLRPSLAVALGGFVLPFVLGALTAYLFGGTLYQSLFVGMGTSITAIAVQTVVLKSLRINRTELGHIIIGAALVDDLLALVTLSVLLGLARSGRVDVAGIGFIVLKVLAFFGVTIFLGEVVLPRFTRRITDEGGKAVTFALVVALVMAFLAEEAGLHHVIGAFLAGQFVRREIMRPEVYEIIEDRFYGLSYGFLLPVFFVTLAFHLHWSLDPGFLLLTVAITAVALVGKFVGAGLGLRLFGFGFWECLVVGSGMNGRGAVEMVVAAVAMSLSRELLAQGKISTPLLTEAQFSALVVMAFVTTVLAPISLRWTAQRACRREERAEFCRLLEEARREAVGG